MTGSIDPLACRYAAVASNQTHRVEVITDTESMVKSLLGEYRKGTNTLPDRIIYLRDGVAEGQFAEVIRVELPAIRAAARVVAPGKTVKITVIIVKKRHHTRIFPASPQDGDRNGNVHPGTVVDTGVVHPVEFDFCNFPRLWFMLTDSHRASQSLSGHCSSCSLSYVPRTAMLTVDVIHDENGFKSDQLQTLIYHQSYAFARSSTSVSLRTFPLPRSH
jgi:eukaryotic translation initiation factor 2C